MNFYLPRRHRRPLLFPPGLLALAGLLLVGTSRWVLAAIAALSIWRTVRSWLRSDYAA